MALREEGSDGKQIVAVVHDILMVFEYRLLKDNTATNVLVIKFE